MDSRTASIKGIYEEIFEFKMRDIFEKESDYMRLEPIKLQTIKEAERSLGVKLPEKYIELLEIQNGGSIILNGHPSSPNSWADDHVHIESIYGISLNKDIKGFTNSIMDSSYYIKEWGLPKNIILLCGDGHTWIALDYNKSITNPPVIYIDIEEEEELLLANNFEDCINGLRDFE